MEHHIEVEGKKYSVAWGNLAQMRVSLVPESVRNAPGTPAFIAAFAWCCIAQKPNPFPTWEHLAELVTIEDTAKFAETLNDLFAKPDAEKKSSSSDGLTPESTSG